MKKRRLFLMATCLFFGIENVWAAAPYDGFATYANSASLLPFARDLGGILGSSTFHSGRILGFSGFDAGVHVAAQFAPEEGDQILRNNGVRAFGLPMVQAEVGMPFRIDGFVRGMSYGGLTVAGGGLRYGIIKPKDTPWSPQLMASGVADSVTQQDFSASHFGFNLVASMGTQMFTPYLGAGLDWTNLSVKNSILEPSLDGQFVHALGDRFTAGIQFRPGQFFYTHIAYVLLHGENGAEGGLGIRF
jgi:hypothetical protein